MNYKVTEYKNEIPVNEFFDNYHHSMYCNTAYIEHFMNDRPVYLLEVFEGEKLLSCIFYSLNKKAVNVLGTLNQYTDDEITLFCDYLFKQFKDKYINWGGFYHPYNSDKYKVYKTGIVSDIIMVLPATEEEYLGMLNSTTRKHVKYYKRRFLKEFKDAELHCYRNEEISSDLIEKIVYFNHLRMEDKNTVSDLDEEYTRALYEMCQRHGVVHTVERNGALIGATINVHVNGHSHLGVIAHDPDYNKYNPGQIALYDTVVDAIRDHDQCFHFLWEICDYKKRFGGHLVELYYYHIYPGISLSSVTDKVKCNVTCSLMYFQKRSAAGRKIIDRVKKVIGMK